MWRGVFWGRPMQGVDDELRVRGALVAPSVFLAAASFAMFVFAGVVAGWTGAAGDALVDVPAYERAALGEPAEAISYGNLDNVREGATR